VEDNSRDSPYEENPHRGSPYGTEPNHDSFYEQTDDLEPIGFRGVVTTYTGYEFFKTYPVGDWNEATGPPALAITAARGRGAWECDYPHAWGRYYVSSRRRSCPGCGSLRRDTATVMKWDLSYEDNGSPKADPFEQGYVIKRVASTWYRASKLDVGRCRHHNLCANYLATVLNSMGVCRVEIDKHVRRPFKLLRA
jgi:hypothetical protein